MKAFFVLALLVGVSYALPRQEKDCATCMDGTMKLMNALNTDESLERQKELLIEEACPEFEEGCDKGVMNWWSGIGHALYPAPELTSGICAYLDPSCAMDARAWDCDTCKQRLLDVGEAMVEGTENIVTALAGENFCENPMNNFSADDTATCKGAIESFMPVAIRVLTGAIGDRAEEVCNGVYDNICMAKKFYF